MKPSVTENSIRPAALRAATGPTLALPRGLSVIGAAHDCALRVGGEGVQPRHCLVTLGSRRTIVRTLAPGARVNGQPFEEAELAVGDRLLLGELELEALAPASASPPSTGEGDASRSPPNKPQPSGDDPPRRAVELGQVRVSERGWVDAAMLARAVELRRDLARRGRALRRQHRQLTEALAIARREWTTYSRRVSSTTAAPEGAWSARLDNLRKSVDELASGQLACRGANVELEARLRVIETGLVEAQGHREIDDQQAAAALAETERLSAAWQSMHDRLEYLIEADHQIRGAVSTAIVRGDAFERLASDWAQRLDHLERSFEEVSSVRGELDTIRHSLVDQANRLESLAERQPQAASVDPPDWDSLVGRCEKLEHELAGIHARQAAWQADRDGLRDEHRRSQEQLSIRSEQIDRKLESLALQQQVMQDRRDAHARDDDARSHGQRTQIEQRLTELRVERENLEQERRRAHAERALERYIEPRPANVDLSDLIGRDAGVPAGGALETAVEDIPAEPAAVASPTPPVEAAIVEERIDEAAVDEAPVPPAENAIDAEPIPCSEPPRDVEKVPSPPMPDKAEADAKEESIEEYMARLMNRVRGISQATTQPAALDRPSPRRPDDPPPVAARPDMPGEGPIGEAPSTSEAPFTIRRRPAPEQPADLSAMRELANMNARQALEVHSRKRLGSKMNGKLIVALAACLSVGVLLGMGAWRSPLFQAGLGVSLVAALAWSVQYVTLRRKLKLVAEQAPESDESPTESEAARS